MGAKTVTLADGSIHEVTRNNYGELAALQQSLTGADAQTSHSIADAFRQLAGFDVSGFTPQAAAVKDGAFGPGVPNEPGGGNSFFAGLDLLLSHPGNFASNIFGSGDTVRTDSAPGGGYAFVAGVEELALNPHQFAADLPGLPGLPGGPGVSLAIILGVAAVALGVGGYVVYKLRR